MIIYTYLVTNTGNVTISGLIIDDDIATDESCPAGDLTPGAALTCTASHIITPADFNAGSVTNVAAATGTDPNDQPVTSPTDTVTVTDTTPPTLTQLSANPEFLWPPNGDIIPVTVSGVVSDNSDVTTLRISFDVFDDPQYTDTPGVPIAQGDGIIPLPDGSFSFVTALEASRFGNDKDGRPTIP